VVGLGLVLLPLAALAAEGVAYINSDRVRFEYEGARDIENQLQASLSDWQARAREMEREIETMIGEIEAQRLILSEEAIRERELAIQQKRMEFEDFVNSVWGVGGLAAQREAELWQPVFDTINGILKEIGQEGDYDMILDAAQMGIVYADPSTDLTQQVIDALNSAPAQE
jgi:outer membrane protein